MLRTVFWVAYHYTIRQTLLWIQIGKPISRSGKLFSLWLHKELLRLRQTRMCLHMFAGSEPYHMARSIAILRDLGNTLFRPSTQQKWPWDSKLTQSCRVCIHFSAYVLTFIKLTFIRLNRENVKQKYGNRISHISQRVLVSSMHNDRGLNELPLLRARENPAKHNLITAVLSDIMFNFEF